MVDLARQAFDTQNYDLAAEIYERSLRENGPSEDVVVCLADSYARAGQLKKAFSYYSQAYRLGSLKSDRLSHLVTALVDMMGAKEDLKPKPKANQEQGDIFGCASCKAIWNEPVTLPSCGHTFCRKCLEKSDSKSCKTCGVNFTIYTRIANLKNNILLSELTFKWFPQEVRAVKLKADGNLYFAKQDYKQAIDFYSKAFVCAPRDHLIASNRSFAYASLDQFPEALQDAELAIELRPDWPKGYYRKGMALSGLGRHEEAAFALLQCLSLDPSVTSARSSLATALHRVLSPLPPEDLKRAELHNMLSPSPLARALGPSGATYGAHSSPMLSVETLQQLKAALRETVLHSGMQLRETAGQHGGNVPNKPQFTFEDATSVQDEENQCHLKNTFPQIHHHTDSNTCHSAPNSLPPSPLVQEKRSHSVSEIGRREHDSLSRKRSHWIQEKEDRHIAEPMSPTKTMPPKLARSDGEVSCDRRVPADLLNKEDFECSLCFRLLFLPVTTPCGHTFCRQCLDRCLDHGSCCPLCKTTLVEYLAERNQSTTEAVEQVVRTYFPKDFLERKIQYEEEMESLAKMGAEKQYEVPIFVCTVSFPTVPCPLHVFEPRYRLMIRQCMESGARQFGMCVCLQDNENNFSDIGCMLEIRDVQYFPDGRSVVDTIGGRRFRVIDRGMKDGYNVAQVEFLQDVAVSGNEAQELLMLHNEVHQEAMDWFNALPEGPRGRILQHFGPFPEQETNVVDLPNGPAWSWYMVAILPLPPQAQVTILAMCSFKERLHAIRRVLNYVKRRGSR